MVSMVNVVVIILQFMLLLKKQKININYLQRRIEILLAEKENVQ